MDLAIAEVSGSNITTRPLKSSLKLVDLHFGQTFSFVIKWQLLHDFSLILDKSPYASFVDASGLFSTFLA